MTGKLKEEEENRKDSALDTLTLKEDPTTKLRELEEKEDLLINLDLIIEYLVLGANSKTNLQGLTIQEEISIMEVWEEIKRELLELMRRMWEEDPMGRSLKGTTLMLMLEEEEECKWEEPEEEYSEEEEACLWEVVPEDLDSMLTKLMLMLLVERRRTTLSLFEKPYLITLKS